MNSEAVVIIGSGGRTKVVIELLRAEGKYQIRGYGSRRKAVSPSAMAKE